VANYAQVKYAGVYPGVDLVYYGNQGGQLEYDFVVAAGADPGAIAQSVGAVGEPSKAHRDASLRIAANGDLVIPTGAGELRFRKPVVYQEKLTADSRQLTVQGEARRVGTRQSTSNERQFVDGRFTLDGQDQVHFALGP
jgi:hypothetical protein